MGNMPQGASPITCYPSPIPPGHITTPYYCPNHTSLVTCHPPMPTSTPIPTMVQWHSHITTSTTHHHAITHCPLPIAHHPPTLTPTSAAEETVVICSKLVAVCSKRLMC